MRLLENSFNRPIFPLSFFSIHSRSASESTRSTRVANGPLGNNGQGNERTEMAHLIAPSPPPFLPLTIYRYRSDGVAFVAEDNADTRYNWATRALASTYCIDGVYNCDRVYAFTSQDTAFTDVSYVSYYRPRITWFGSFGKDLPLLAAWHRRRRDASVCQCYIIIMSILYNYMSIWRFRNYCEIA